VIVPAGRAAEGVDIGVGDRLGQLVGGGVGQRLERRQPAGLGVGAAGIGDDREGVLVVLVIEEGAVIAEKIRREVGVAVDGDVGRREDEVEPVGAGRLQRPVGDVLGEGV